MNDLFTPLAHFNLSYSFVFLEGATPLSNLGSENRRWRLVINKPHQIPVEYLLASMNLY